jgi:hypothetical protein
MKMIKGRHTHHHGSLYDAGTSPEVEQTKSSRSFQGSVFPIAAFNTRCGTTPATEKGKTGIL